MKRLAYSLLAAALLILAASPVLAQGEDLTKDELVSLVGEAVVQEAADSSEEVARAKRILDAVRGRKDAPQQEVSEAQMDYDRARDRYRKAESDLDNAKVNELALQCNKTSDQIRAMRDSGMGWGRIAKECGMHGVGKGKNKNKGTDDDMAQSKSKSKNKDKKPKKK
ncbi:hypothetical protein DND132_1024 [Pseudodesulfovibrio mercurii]|uniref:Uncharacterized protein n=1 Tax=Pseudodesulfovibrio mercurii TaxID=641491 RepID=F0JII5_9BACT|nr:hypothetical protein [Pseudodesulfovibrio mercurii]EGB14237.1 hypothetical protein DND132_1024 [Pseudodesulfovibrio mercurii]